MKQGKIIIWLTILLAIVFFVQSCTNGDGPTASESKETKWKEVLIKERQEKDNYFKTFPDSPMARSKRLVVLPDRGEIFVRETEKGVSLSENKTPDTRLSIVHREGKWSWNSHADGITCNAGKQAVAPGSPLPYQASFQLVRCVLKTYALEERFLILVHDPERPKFKHFSHLLYFPPDAKYAVKAFLEKFPTIEKFKVLTSQKEEKTYHRYARVKFQLDGKPFQLTAFKFNLDTNNPESEILFIPFSDATSSKETYEGGRFLEIHEPKEKEFILDFNRCFNPLCNYSPGYNCPIPPLENHLQIPINAGEKTYPH